MNIIRYCFVISTSEKMLGGNSMKKLITAALALMIAFMSFGCGAGNGKYSGLVVACGGNPQFFELQTTDKNYGFVIDDNTELVWEDTTAVDRYAGWDEWSVFSCCMQVTVEAGSKTVSVKEYTNEDLDDWFIAKKVTVTKVEDDYFSADE